MNILLDVREAALTCTTQHAPDRSRECHGVVSWKVCVRMEESTRQEWTADCAIWRDVSSMSVIGASSIEMLRGFLSSR